MRSLFCTISSTLAVDGGSILAGEGPAEDACACVTGQYDEKNKICGKSSPLGVLKYVSNVVMGCLWPLA